jgi:hypothetical protein
VIKKIILADIGIGLLYSTLTLLMLYLFSNFISLNLSCGLALSLFLALTVVLFISIFGFMKNYQNKILARFCLSLIFVGSTTALGIIASASYNSEVPQHSMHKFYSILILCKDLSN